MKTVKIVLVVAGLGFFASSCNVFKPKYGCPTDGRATGAESILSGDGPKKAKKFKA